MSHSISQLLADFAYQSYFDSTLREKALLVQSVGNPIVASTRQYAQTPGEGLVLHPLSQSPVAVKFRGGEADSIALTLTPGQKVRVGSFKEFEWGLPFGWLGGGQAELYVLHGKNSDIEFPGVNQIVPFHRQRLAIVAPSGTYVRNWPGAFPWANALRGTGSEPQQAAAMFAPVPDIAMMRLRTDLTGVTPIVPATLTAVFRGITHFDLNSNTGVLGTTDLTAYDVTFRPHGDVAGGEFSIAWLPAEVTKIAGYACSIQLVDPLNLYRASFVDVVRYGRLA